MAKTLEILHQDGKLTRLITEEYSVYILFCFCSLTVEVCLQYNYKVPSNQGRCCTSHSLEKIYQVRSKMGLKIGSKNNA